MGNGGYQRLVGFANAGQQDPLWEHPNTHTAQPRVKAAQCDQLGPLPVRVAFASLTPHLQPLALPKPEVKRGPVVHGSLPTLLGRTPGCRGPYRSFG